MKKRIEVSMEVVGKVNKRDIEFVLSEKFGDKNLIKNLVVEQIDLEGDRGMFTTPISAPLPKLIDTLSITDTLEKYDEPYVIVEEEYQYVVYTQGNPLTETEKFAIVEKENIKKAKEMVAGLNW